MPFTSAPDRTEAAEYYFPYIDMAPAGDIRATLAAQLPEMLALFRTISEEQSLLRYAPDKWSIRELLSHINDSERMFTFRALWFARGFDSALPSFDQNVAITSAGADKRSWQSHMDEFEAVRNATVALVRNLPNDSWLKRGTASGYSFTVRALTYVVAGHAAHHVNVLKERYLHTV